MKILITGGSGFIGSYAVEHYLNMGLEVTVLDNLTTGKFMHPGAKFEHGDIRDEHKMKWLVGGFDAILHLAAMVSISDSCADPDMAEAVNVKGTINLLKHFSGKTFIYASSAAVYGMPYSPYGITKLSGEYWVKYFAHTNGFNHFCLRFFNVFGPRQSMYYAAAVPTFIARAKANEDIIIHGDGSQTRDFIYVEDLVDAIYSLHSAEVLSRMDDPIDIGYGESISITKLEYDIIRLTGSKSKVVYDSSRSGGMMFSDANTWGLKYIRWQPKYGLEKGLEKTILP